MSCACVRVNTIRMNDKITKLWMRRNTNEWLTNNKNNYPIVKNVMKEYIGTVTVTLGESKMVTFHINNNSELNWILIQIKINLFNTNCIPSGY